MISNDLELGDGLSVRMPARLPRLTRRERQPQDTEAGCRASAAADLARAATMDTDQGRWRLEHSAASWTSRANLIHRMDEKHEAMRVGKRV